MRVVGHFAEDSEVDLSPGMGRTLGFRSEPMKSAVLLFATFLLLSLATATAAAKSSSIGIYAVIDEVKFDQDGPSSNLVRISGVFSVPRPMSSGEYQTPQRGYLYFRISPGAEQAARKDWNQLKAVAGTGQVVGFAFYWVPNPSDPQGNPHHSLELKVRSDGDATPPDVYPIPHPSGVVKAGDHDRAFDEKIAAQLHTISN